MRAALPILLAVSGLDLFVLLVTGRVSLLAPGGGGVGLALRLVVLALLIVAGTVLGKSPRPGRLVLFVLLLPTLFEFQYTGSRLKGDGVMYFVYTRSLAKDFDVDLEDEYAHYGLLTRGDLAMPVKATGLRRSIFAVGPALLSLPFFEAGDIVARGEALFGGRVDLDGYSREYTNAVGLGGLLYGFAAVVLIHETLLAHFSEGVALLSAILAWGATFLHWYMVFEPAMSHATSAFAAALVLFLWERGREGRGALGFLLLGLVLGLAMCVRWQNGVLLVLPFLELASRLRSGEARFPLLGCGALVLFGALVGVLPQLLVWKAIYGTLVLLQPPHGADFLRLDHPFLLDTFFSSRHGLFSWTPVFWLGYLGFYPLLRRKPALAATLLVPLVLMSYVNVCSGDWWAGGSFSNRRFDSLIPILALGFAASLESAEQLLRSRPILALGALAVFPIVWNLSLVEVVRRELVPRDDTVAFPDLVFHSAEVFSEGLGSPTTWPASWIFAWREKTSPGRYDRLVGRYLFYRQNNLGGHIGLAEEGYEDLLGEGWGKRESVEDVPARAVSLAARVFVPLDVPEDLSVRFRTYAPADGSRVRVSVNGREAALFAVGTAWSPVALRVDSSLWRREINDLVFEAQGGPVYVSGMDFERVGRGQ